MSIQSEVERLNNAKEAIAGALQSMGIAPPTGTTLEQYAAQLTAIAVSAPWLSLTGGTLSGALKFGLDGDSLAIEDKSKNGVITKYGTNSFVKAVFDSTDEQHPRIKLQTKVGSTLGNANVNGVADPEVGEDAANKKYVDNLAATKEPAITTLPVSKGGTGANTASAALTNLGAAAEEHAHTAAQVGAAPTAHASTATTYGAGSASNYGHVKLSDSTSTASGASEGIAATPTAVKAAYDLAASKEESFSVLPVSKGGTGATTEAAARTSLGITPSNIGAAASTHNHAAGDITSGTLAVARGGTGVTAVGGTDYTTTRFRGSQLRSADTNPTTNGTINWTYE